MVRAELVVEANLLVEDGATKDGGAIEVGFVGLEKIKGHSSVTGSTLSPPVPRFALPSRLGFAWMLLKFELVRPLAGEELKVDDVLVAQR